MISGRVKKGKIAPLNIRDIDTITSNTTSRNLIRHSFAVSRNELTGSRESINIMNINDDNPY